MGFLAKLFRRPNAALHEYSLRLALRGPTGETRHQFVKFEARSVVTALQHAQKRAGHESVLRWKLFDAHNRQVAAGRGGRKAQSASDSDEVVHAERS